MIVNIEIGRKFFLFIVSFFFVSWDDIAQFADKNRSVSARLKRNGEKLGLVLMGTVLKSSKMTSTKKLLKQMEFASAIFLIELFSRPSF